MTETMGVSDSVQAPRDTRLELFVQQDEEGAVAAFAPVRWFIEDELVRQIETRGFHNPHLVLAIRAEGNETFLRHNFNAPKETGVYVVPLKRGMEYVTFRRAGPNEIRAIIVNAPDQKAVAALRRIKRAKPGENAVFEEDGTPSLSTIRGEFQYIELDYSLTVDVDEEMFAEPPPVWRDKLVRRFFPNRDADQCHLRRRTILSFIGAFFLLTLGQALKLISLAIVAVLGGRDIQWKEVFHPWKGEVFGPIHGVDTFLWFQDKRGHFSWTPMLTINPSVLIGLPALVYLFQQWYAHNANHGRYQLGFPGWWGIAYRVDFWVVAGTIGAVIVILAVAGIGMLVEKVGSSESHRERADRQAAEAARARRSRTLTSLEGLARPQILPQQISLNTLPKGNRTVHLRFSNLKTKVCKPFQS